MRSRKEESSVTVDYADLGPELLVEHDDNLRIVTMNRPEHLNAFSASLHDAMCSLWDRLDDDEEADAVLLTGAGSAFSAGGDMELLLATHRDRKLARHNCREAERLARAYINCELPIVAAVNGPAVGLGCSLAVLADFVVMSEDTFMADPHVSVGVVAGDGGVLAWPLMMSLLQAKEYLLLGDRIPAADCFRLGLANRVVAKDEVLPTALEIARRLAAKPRQAVRDTKRVLNIHLQMAADAVLPFALAAEEATFALDDVRDVAMSFLAKQRRTTS
jgi:enoyl-CoA hydratase